MFNLSYEVKSTSGFHSFKGTPENLEELDETLSFFLEEQKKFDGKRLSGQRIANLKKIFDGLEQTRLLAEQRSEGDLLEEVDRRSKELEHYRVELEEAKELAYKFWHLMDMVVKSSNKFIVKVRISLMGGKSKAVRNLEKFLDDNNLKVSDFDEDDIERLRRYEIGVKTD